MLEKIKESPTYLKEKTGLIPEIGIVLGTGLWGLVKEIQITHSIEHKNIPNFPLQRLKATLED